MEVTKIYQLAGGLNIEGGFPGQILKTTNGNGLWINLILVLDRPLIDNILFDEIFLNNKYPLLENAISEINEHNFLAIYLMIICYYIENGRQIIKKNINDTLTLTIHIHQDVIALALINIINTYLDIMITKLNINITNVKINYKTDIGTFVNTTHEYNDTDILISLSQCAGLDPRFKAGTLLIPNQFIPYDIDNQSINLTQKYKVDNNLLTNLKEIISSRFYDASINLINNHYISSNPQKINDKCQKISMHNFHITDILQVDKLWNPKNINEMINIIK